MTTDTPRSYLLSIALVCAGLVGLLGCGSASSTAPPSAATAPSAAAASSLATTPLPSTVSPSPEVGGVCVPEMVRFDPADFVLDGTQPSTALTGAWAGDDGGIYYLRQLGSVVWWNGMSSRNGPPIALGRDWNNVARGEIKKDLTIAVEWADVPRGSIDGHGTLDLKIGADSAGALQITKTGETGTGFGNSLWTRCAPGFVP